MTFSFLFQTIFTLILHPMAPTTKYFLNLYSLPKLPVEYEQVSLLQVNTMAATTTGRHSNALDFVTPRLIG